MTETRLPGSSISTSPVGVGCAYLTEGILRDQDRPIIDAAFEAGARHFDVAPSYGMGTAEAVLGRALRGRRDRVTLASKVGIARNEAKRGKLVLRALLAPTRGLRPRAPLRSGPKRGLDFSAVYVRAALEDSLRRLRTDYLDVYFLHEVTPEHITDELIDFLLAIKAAGRVRALGIASSRASASEVSEAWPGIFEVIQHSWSALDPPLDPSSQFRITHRSIFYSLAPLHAWLRGNASVARRLSEATLQDVTDKRVLSSLLLGAARSENAEGVVLVASRSRFRTRANIESALDPTIVDAGRRLRAALVEEPDLPTPA